MNYPHTYTDQMGYDVHLEPPPQRIVSLVPSQTDTLLYLGLGERLVGITLFCVHPKETVKGITKVGGTKNPRIQDIQALKPDLVIANKEENRKEDIEAIKAFAPVWISNVNTPSDSLDMIQSLGQLTGLHTESLVSGLQSDFDQIARQADRFQDFKTCYLIWKDPYMVAGKETYIDACLKLAGFQNMIEESRYPEINLETLADADLILLSSEPFPFKNNHVKELQSKHPQARVELVDGEMFSWYGSRQLHWKGYLDQLERRIKA